ncbi:hypothetical protein [Parabacteroides sp. FAFU027]|uniref:hypothetical protein n=1 Tax=Parabacteroides sp. FAFU027 TaxID=2922715 RepID=UPI001FAFC7BC|nr:hypothetical protein [Parabacteroides sp. FAFU027]
MNRVLLSLLVLLFGTLISCRGVNHSNETIKAIEKTDSCLTDAANKYEVYIPARTKEEEKLPLLVIIDAHGSGKFALNKFKLAAGKYPMILVASDYVKNGFEGYDRAIQTLINDVRSKYPVGKALFLTGFSGGARMALGYALGHPADGLILCGALAGRNEISTLSCPIISISGTDDFNFMETAQYLFQEESLPHNLKIELTNASHSWPDSLILDNAVGYLHFVTPNAESANTRTQLTAYNQQQQTRIESLKQQGDYLKAALIARNMASVELFDWNKTFATTYNSLKNDVVYRNQLSRLGNCLNYEIGMRQTYVEAFNTKESNWWKNEINTVEGKIKTEQDAMRADMYRRIKGFWGIVCYSLGKQAIAQHNADLLNRVLFVYRTIEPENSEMYYYSAFPPFWQGNNEATISVLRKALKAGFTDLNRLKTDFPESISSKL